MYVFYAVQRSPAVASGPSPGSSKKASSRQNITRQCLIVWQPTLHHQTSDRPHGTELSPWRQRQPPQRNLGPGSLNQRENLVLPPWIRRSNSTNPPHIRWPYLQTLQICLSPALTTARPLESLRYKHDIMRRSLSVMPVASVSVPRISAADSVARAGSAHWCTPGTRDRVGSEAWWDGGTRGGAAWNRAGWNGADV